MAKLSKHPNANVIQGYFSAHYDQEINFKREYMFLPYTHGGDLLDHIMTFSGELAIKPNNIIRQKYVLNMFFMFMQGLLHLHTLGIAHLDIKPENILLIQRKVKGGSSRMNYVPKISDFGHAKAFIMESSVTLSPSEFVVYDSEWFEIDVGTNAVHLPRLAILPPVLSSHAGKRVISLNGHGIGKLSEVEQFWKVDRPNVLVVAEKPFLTTFFGHFGTHTP